MIYLDYQATTPLAPEARDAMMHWLDGPDGDGFANPAAQYRAGRQAAVAVEMARDAVAALFPKGGQVVFTSGATEALNWAILIGDRERGKGALGTAIEHPASLQCLEKIGAGVIPVDGAGLVAATPDVDAIPQGGVLAMMLVNNEVGTIQPVEDYADAARAKGALVVCDAVQGYGRVAMPENVDLIAVSAHKLHGPKGIGALWVRDGVHLPPMMLGGAQEMGHRSGTVSPALCAGFGAAATLATARRAEDAAHVAHLWDVACEEMAGWTVNGSTSRRYKGNLNIRRDGVNAARLLSDVRNVAFSLGSACASGSGRTSHVLRAMGVSEQHARSSIRLGWGRYTREEDLRAGLQALKQAADQQMEGRSAA